MHLLRLQFEGRAGNFRNLLLLNGLLFQAKVLLDFPNQVRGIPS